MKYFVILLFSLCLLVGCSSVTEPSESEIGHLDYFDKADPIPDEDEQCHESCGPMMYCMLKAGHTGMHQCP